MEKVANLSSGAIRAAAPLNGGVHVIEGHPAAPSAPTTDKCAVSDSGRDRIGSAGALEKNGTEISV
jgi:hypothetical protein